MDEYVEITRAAQLLGASYWQTRDAALKGLVRAEKRANRWFLHRADVERLARTRAAGAADAPQPAA